MARLNIRALLATPSERRRMFIRCIIAAQAREGITTSVEQAEAAYDAVQKEKRAARPS